IFTGLGVLFSLFYSLTVLPAMLTLIDPKRLASAGASQTGEGRLAAWFSRFASVVVQYRYGVIGILIITLILAPFGLRRLVIQDSWIDGFARGSEFRRVMERVNEDFYGIHLLLISFDAQERFE